MTAFFCRQCGNQLTVADGGASATCPSCGAAVSQITVAASEFVEERAEQTVAPREDDKQTLPPDPPSAGATAEMTQVWDGNGALPCDWGFLAPAQRPDEIGRLGRYRVLAVMGAGGMGVVFRAEDPQLERHVALKVMLPTVASNPTAKDRFFREARAAAALKHRHIITIHDVAEDRGTPFLSMELLEGESLDARLKRVPAPTVIEIVRIGREIAEGLAVAHSKELIHRDIKPVNIWLESATSARGEASVKILDFGLARALADQTHLTNSGTIVGTPAYMAPEQAAGKAVDHRADLFSLGCVLYRMCTGQKGVQGLGYHGDSLGPGRAPPTSAELAQPRLARRAIKPRDSIARQGPRRASGVSAKRGGIATSHRAAVDYPCRSETAVAPLGLDCRGRRTCAWIGRCLASGPGAGERGRGSSPGSDIRAVESSLHRDHRRPYGRNLERGVFAQREDAGFLCKRQNRPIVGPNSRKPAVGGLAARQQQSHQLRLPT